MLRIRLHLGSKSIEDYLNKMANKGYILDSLTPFGLFEPLRIDTYRFTKSTHKNRTYRVDSRNVDRHDFNEYRQIFLDDGWTYFKNNQANDEFNKENIFYSDTSTKNEIFSDEESRKKKNRDNASSTLLKGIFLFMTFLVLSRLFPAPFSGSSHTIVGFILHNSYVIIAIVIMLVSLIRYIKYK